MRADCEEMLLKELPLIRACLEALVEIERALAAERRYAAKRTEMTISVDKSAALARKIRERVFPNQGGAE